MSTVSADRPLKTTSGARRIAYKVWREVKRPFRSKVRTSTGISEPTAPFNQLLTAGSLTFSSGAAAPLQPVVETKKPYLTGTGATVEGFHPHQATVEPDGLPLVKRLVRQSCRYDGPIIEIGTLLGVTTTTMALAKAPQQKIITVDLYCWNPWNFPPDVHEALTSQMLHYLVRTGHVERIRMDKNEFFRAYDGPSPAMVFLDAVHDYEETKKDIVWAKQVGARIIAGHDYCDEFPGVKAAVDEFGGPAELAATVWLLK